MHLVYSTTEFLLDGVSRPGFPILLWEGMTSCWPANQFFRSYLMRGTIESKRSWSTIATALYDYFSFLEAHKLAWDDADRGENKNLVSAYRDYCYEAFSLKRNTVRNRVTYVTAFYKFARRRGWIDALPFDAEVRQGPSGGGFLGHLDQSGGKHESSSALPRRHKTLVKYLTARQAKLLSEAATNPHHHAIIRLALKSGLRREELASFPLSYVFDPHAAGVKTRNVRVNLDPEDGSGMKTKGSRPRTIVIPKRTMTDLHLYVKQYRGERASLSAAQYPNLFLNQDGQPWANDGQGIEPMVKRVGAKVGIRTHPHMLRHTYATQTLAMLQKHRGTIDPVVFLKAQLGHASLETVLVYTHLINEAADEAVLEYDEELNDLVGR